ncbi:MAG: response regulator transcription factor [Bdellovibrionales bacterium]|nr:response regulator transcription factor [Bdellovibrionales bacterium]
MKRDYAFDRKKILVVEDSAEYQAVLMAGLSPLYELKIATSCKEAVELLGTEDFCAAVLDLGLPDENGTKIVSFIQESERLRGMPIICATAKDSIEYKTACFSLGATDFVSKPYSPIELHLVLDAKFRLLHQARQAENVMSFPSLLINLSRHTVHVIEKSQRKQIELSPLEFKLLSYLASHNERVFSREQLLDEVWGASSNIVDRSVDSCIAKLRSKLGDLNSYIKSIHGVGYKFSPSQQMRGMQ